MSCDGNCKSCKQKTVMVEFRSEHHRIIDSNEKRRVVSDKNNESKKEVEK